MNNETVKHVASLISYLTLFFEMFKPLSIFVGRSNLQRPRVTMTKIRTMTNSTDEIFIGNRKHNIIYRLDNHFMDMRIQQI